MAIKGNKSHGEDTRNQVEQVFQALLDHQDKTGSLRNILVHDLWQTINTKEKKEAIKKEEIKRAFGDLVTLKILIDERGSKRQGAYLWHFDLKLECAHDREASLKEFRQSWEKRWGTGKTLAQKQAEKPQLPTNNRTIDYGPYLRSLINDSAYQRTWGFYTPTDAKPQTQPSPIAPELDFELMAQLLPAKQDPEGTQAKSKPLPVLSAIEQYAAEHVLLIGRPGSGKSTALRRLLIDKAKLTLEDTSAQIPVLVELRYLDVKKPSVLKRIQDFLRSHDLHLEEETLIQELRAGRFLLLIDGVNELPSEATHQSLIAFRKVYGKTAMVFSTRDITLNGDLGIHNKLEIQPLSKLQMRQFIKTSLPAQGDALLQQLEGKLQQVSETPLFLWMLCEISELREAVPSSVGELFQRFTTDYEQIKRREGASVSEGFWLWHTDLLEELAWQMMQIKGTDTLKLTISRAAAEAVLKKFLKGEVEYPTQWAKKWLQELQDHHLLQRASPSQIEFHHQLFQEYYAAKALGRRLPFLSDEELKRDYLNHLKWTESFGLLLAVMEDDSQALRVVRLALNEVNLMLGAKLSGKVKSELQETTVSWIEQLDIPLREKLECLKASQSKYTVPRLIEALDHSDFGVQCTAAEALGNLRSPEAIPPLISILQDSFFLVQQAAAEALGKLGSPEAISPLISILQDSIFSVRWAAIEALGRLESPEIISSLISTLQNSNNEMRQAVAEALGKLGSPEAIPPLISILQDSNDEVRWAAADTLINLGSPEAIPPLINILQNSSDEVQQAAAITLGNLGSPEAIPPLINILQNSSDEVQQAAAITLGNLGSPEAISPLINILQNSSDEVQQAAASALGMLGSPEAISPLINILQNSSDEVQQAVAIALGNLGSPEAISPLINILQNSDNKMRQAAASALGKLRSPEAIPFLINTFRDSDIWVNLTVTEALENLGSPEVIPALIKTLQDSDNKMRQAAASALGKLRSLEAISPLINALRDSDYWVREAAASALVSLESSEIIFALINLLQDSNIEVRWTAAIALGKLGSPKAIPFLISTLQNSNYWVRQAAAEALGKLGSPKEIPVLVNAVRNSDGWDSAIYRAIADIQRRYGFYNYDLMQKPKI